jgi:hypothetical protein
MNRGQEAPSLLVKLYELLSKGDGRGVGASVTVEGVKETTMDETFPPPADAVGDAVGFSPISVEFVGSALFFSSLSLGSTIVQWPFWMVKSLVSTKSVSAGAGGSVVSADAREKRETKATKTRIHCNRGRR